MPVYIIIFNVIKKKNSHIILFEMHRLCGTPLMPCWVKVSPLSGRKKLEETIQTVCEWRERVEVCVCMYIECEVRVHYA